jgi:hypothetical protein
MSKKALTFKAPKAEAPKAPSVKPLAPKAKAITKAKEAPKAPPTPTPLPTPTLLSKADKRALRTPEQNQVLTNAALKAWATRRAKADAAKAEADAKAKADAKAPKKGRKSA